MTHLQASLKSLIEEHARLDFSYFLSTQSAIFYVINKKFHPAYLFNNLLIVNKQAGPGGTFSNPACLFRSASLLGTSEYTD